MSNTKNTNLFIGGMDLDSDPLNIEVGDWKHALNVVNGNLDENTAGGIANTNGLFPVNNQYIIGTGDDNSCIGTYEDLKENTSIYFIWNRFGYHGIYRYYRNTVNNAIGEIQKLVRIEYPNLYSEDNPNPLGFTKDNLITGIVLVDGILFWTNNVVGRRCININKANETDKKRKFNLYFHKENFNVPRGYRVSLFAQGNPLPVNVFDFTTAAASYQETCAAFKDAFALAPVVNTFYSCVNEGNNIQFELVRYGQYFMYVQESLDGFVTFVNKSVIVPDNFYPEKDLGIESGGTPTYDIFGVDLIDAIKYPSFCEPLTAYKTDVTQEVNLVRDKYFQFRTKYIYDNYENTVYGTISKVPMPRSKASVDIGISENYIQIDCNDPRLSNPAQLSVMKNLVVAFSDDGRVIWKNLKALELYEFAGGQTFDFYNNGAYGVVPPAEAELPSSAEPITCEAQELVDDRIFVNANKENYDKPDITAVVTQEFEVNPEVQRYSIKGRIYIRDHYTDDLPQSAQYIYRKHYDTAFNPSAPATNVYGGMYNDGVSFSIANPQLVGQVMPNGGWVAYLAGTDYSAVSKQVISPAYDPSLFPNSNGIDIRTLIGSDGVFDIFNDFQASDILLAAGGEQGFDTRYVYSEFEIKNVPNGTYVLRLSSHATPSTSLVPDFFNSRAYQRTSTNVSALGVGVSGTTEIVINVANSDVTISDTEIYNMITKNVPLIPGDVYKCQQCYLRGNDVVGSTAAEIYGDVSIPLATVKVSYDGGPSYVADIKTGAFTIVLTKTDHNGYFYYYSAADTGTGTVPLTKTTDATSGLYTDALSDSDKYLYLDGAAVPSGGTYLPFFCRVDDPDIKAYSRTYIEGRFSGEQLDNISVIPSSQSPGITGSDGSFRVLVYSDTANPVASIVTNVNIYFASGDNNTILFLPGQQGPIPLSFAVSAFPPFTFNEATPYVFPNEFTNIILVSALSVSVWKPGSETLFGIVYADDGDRKCAVCTNELMRAEIPYLNPTNQQGETAINIGLYHEPPSWATKYYIVRTEDLVAFKFFQWIANEVEYVQNDFITPTAYSNPDAAFLKINLGNIGYYVTNQYPNAFLTSVSWNVGDIVRIITNNAGVPYSTVYEYEIVKGVSATNADIFIYKDPSVDFSSAPGFGMFIEIYQPRNQGIDNLFYECECFPVRASYFNGIKKFYHVGNVQDQSYGTLPLDTVTPAIVKMTRGNAYTRLRNMSVNTPTAPGPIQFNALKVYDDSISDFYPSRVQSLGRVNSDSIIIGRTESPSKVRFTDRYITGTKINGLCMMQPLNYKQFSTDYGAIRKLLLTNDEVLLAFFDNSFQVSMYINKNILREATGQSVVAISEDVIPRSNTMKRWVGTQNPESVVMNDQSDTFVLDNSIGIAARNSGNGIFDISAIKASKFFSNESRARKYPGRTPAVFDLRNNMYLLTLGKLEPSAGEAPVCNIKLPDFDFGYPFAPTQLIIKGTTQPNNLTLFSIDRNNPLFPDTTTMIYFYVNANTATTGYSAIAQSDGSVDIVAPMNSGLFGKNKMIVEVYYGTEIKTYTFNFTLGRDPDIVSQEYEEKTIAFNPRTYDNDSLSRNRWFSFYSFTPEYYGRIGQSVISFVDGKLWLHEIPGINNLFYGVQYNSSITSVINNEFTKVKNFRSIAVKATTKWFIPKDNAVVPPNEQYPTGMKSEVPKQVFVEEEGKYYAEFLQDTLTPNMPTYYDALINGRDLLGNVLIVTLESDDTQRTLLYFSEVIFFNSEYS